MSENATDSDTASVPEVVRTGITLTAAQFDALLEWVTWRPDIEKAVRFLEVERPDLEAMLAWWRSRQGQKDRAHEGR